MRHIASPICYNESVKEKPRPTKWSAEDKFRFTHERLRASTIPNKKRKASREACRKRNDRKEY